MVPRYCVLLNVRTIHRKIETLWEDIQRRQEKILGKTYWCCVDKYKKIVGDAQKLFDVHADDEEQCKKQWRVSMTQRTVVLSGHEGERRMECDHGVDPVCTLP